MRTRLSWTWIRVDAPDEEEDDDEATGNCFIVDFEDGGGKDEPAEKRK